MTLRERLQEDMKSAMRAREAERLMAIRMLLAAIKQREIDERRELDDTEALSIVDKLIKQRKDSANQ
ncbi:MAG: GatB/YqeY domain-containing protein, partial [Acidithiobacillus ferriphilus]